MIESYRFGEMIIDGRAYHADLILYPDRIDASWWRKTGHQLCIADIEDIVAVRPECLIVGTGNPGLLKVLSKTRQYLEEQRIELYDEPTAQAYKTYNKLCSQKRVIGAFHLTC